MRFDAAQTTVRNCGLPAFFIITPGGRPASIISDALMSRALAIGLVAIPEQAGQREREKKCKRGRSGPNAISRGDEQLLPKF